MRKHNLLAWLISACMATSAIAQITATYTTFGSGCSGTGAGLGNGNILPSAAATAFGSGNVIPFGWSPNKYQQVFTGAELPTACVLAALQLRNTNTAPIAVTFVVDMEIKLGLTTRGVGNLSTSFAANWDLGTPIVVLPRSQITIPDAVQPLSTSDFRIQIPFTNTFAWSPAAGNNLLVEVTVYGNSYGSGIYGYPFDNTSGVTSVWGTPETATTGQLRSFGPTMRFVEWTNTAIPRLYSTSTPQIGNTFRVRISQGRASALAVMATGFSSTIWNGNLLPLDLNAQGAPGCTLSVSPDSVLAVILSATGTGSQQFIIPNSIYLLGLTIHNQALVADPTVNALGWVTSNRGTGVLGNQ
jgi:hypothetical protein